MSSGKILGIGAAGLLLTLPVAAIALPGKTVRGENGTVWCCPDGKKGDGCERGASSTPIGRDCNYASRRELSLRDGRLLGAEAPRTVDTPRTPRAQRQ